MTTTGIPAKVKKLDKVPHLQPRVLKKSKTRRLSAAVEDRTAEELAAAEKPSEMAAIALKVGIRVEEILERADAAPNFGQFRMVLGNRIRGTIARIAEAKKAGAKVDEQLKTDCAYPKEARARARKEKALKPKPAKKKEPAKKKVTKKKVTKKKVSKKKLTKKPAEEAE